jgi:hypothetical protein
MIFKRRQPVDRSGRPQSVDVRLVDARLTRAAHVVSTTQGDETILLDPRRGQYHTLNQVGGTVWGLLATGTSVDEIVDAINREYDVPPDAPVDGVRRDVTGLLTALDAAGLLSTDRTPRFR